MANEERLKILKSGDEKWNKWRWENRDDWTDLNMRCTNKIFAISSILIKGGTMLKDIKFYSLIGLSIFIVLSIGCNQQNTKDYPILKGDYLGQKAPGLKPELFAPGIVYTGLNELNSVFSPDGNEFYFSIWMPTGQIVIMMMRQVNNQWTKPQVAPFSGQYSDADPFITYDGKKIFFISNRPRGGENKPNDYDIWVTERISKGWSEPKNLGPPVNSDKNEYYPSLTKDETLYFTSRRDGAKGGSAVYHTRLLKEQYTSVEMLDDNINSDGQEGDIFIGADESYIIFRSRGREEGDGLYISFKKKDGSWVKSKNMGEVINSTGTEYCPIVSPDGKFLFFTSRKNRHKPFLKNLNYEEVMEISHDNNPQNGNGDVYWMDGEVINNLRKEIIE